MLGSWFRSSNEKEELGMSQLQTNRAELIRYIESQGWRYTVRTDNDERYVLRMGFNVDCKLRNIEMLVIADDRAIQSIGVCPINAQRDEYDKVVEYLTRANYGLRIGKFEFDHNDGEVRFQSILPCLAGQPDQRTIEMVVDMPINMFNKYGDGLVKALMGFGDPEADIAAAEA